MIMSQMNEGDPREMWNRVTNPRMKVVYIAGKYRDSCGEYYVRMNIRAAEEAAIFVWQYGGVALCPHKNTAGFGGIPGCHDDVWLRGDIELLRRCDAVWAIEGWRISKGATAEVGFARSNSIPVLYNHQQVIDFILG
jgi:nucleoside 2-deoxyribosyltransferase